MNGFLVAYLAICGLIIGFSAIIALAALHEDDYRDIARWATRVAILFPLWPLMAIAVIAWCLFLLFRFAFSKEDC